MIKNLQNKVIPVTSYLELENVYYADVESVNKFLEDTIPDKQQYFSFNYG